MTTGNDPNDRLSRLMETPVPSAQSTGSQPAGSQPASGTADRARERAQDVADQARSRAQDAADEARRRAEDAGREASSRVDSAMTATGEKMGDAARALRERAPGGQAGEVAHNAARALERGGDYLRRSDPTAVRGDLETIIRDHPIESLAVGLGIGFLLARSMRSRRGYYG